MWLSTFERRLRVSQAQAPFYPLLFVSTIYFVLPNSMINAISRTGAAYRGQPVIKVMMRFSAAESKLITTNLVEVTL